ncbi:MAG TPA: lipocalin family protein [Chitinophagaceae bacterium]|nr:lipocalin family protein [Chitinophagaceae bacterium]
MFKKILKPTALLLIFALGFTSCSKDDDPAPKSKTTLLTQKDWVMTKLEGKVNNEPYLDIFPSLDACFKDDRYVFKTGNTFEFNEGPTKCDPADPQIYETGSWAFTNNETKITIGSDPYSIDQIDENSFIISSSEMTTVDTTVYIKITFGH